MGLRLLWLLLSLTCAGLVRAQEAWDLLYRTEGQIRFLAVDPLQQLYVVTPDNAVWKYDAEGHLQYRFNNNTLGNLALLDVRDPFNVVLYYPEFQRILILDRTLNVQQTYNLWETGLYRPPVVCLSADHQLWVYDEVSFRLRKLDRQGRIILESEDVNLWWRRTPAPSALLVWQQQVLLYDPAEGLYVFDNFGQLQQHIPEKGFDSVSFSGREELVVTREGRWYLWELRSGQLRPLKLPEGLVGQPALRYYDKRLYIPDSAGVAIWRHQ
jgi:hypothetical protein